MAPRANGAGQPCSARGSEVAAQHSAVQRIHHDLIKCIVSSSRGADMTNGSGDWNRRARRDQAIAFNEMLVWRRSERHQGKSRTGFNFPGRPVSGTGTTLPQERENEKPNYCAATRVGVGQAERPAWVGRAKSRSSQEGRKKAFFASRNFARPSWGWWSLYWSLRRPCSRSTFIGYILAASPFLDPPRFHFLNTVERLFYRKSEPITYEDYSVIFDTRKVNRRLRSRHICIDQAPSFLILNQVKPGVILRSSIKAHFKTKSCSKLAGVIISRSVRLHLLGPRKTWLWDSPRDFSASFPA
ncbi:hypothetical protein EJ05DRAFT_524474 [Pseudovirgaria hyperparasitica]|uniref:Uncharacterized protein n=1 Tax=Pseudovirgaria hyperparasitica TaxID=470096 RepID=A0A6A6WEN0_9PEZI|nr:uncharacterized protein EJ05DRAFT_524474 [Pseudovirgaria hyperparasitica]KAF2761173.1 hypothetical protein EJ05DRAFT_524474 [Pseudovirgaria hyperparasitica]